MKNSPLQRIEELISVLPGKDAKLAEKFLKERDFESILELVKSDLYKADRAKCGKLEDVEDSYMVALTNLKGELEIYMSYLDIPDNSDEYDDY